MEFMIKQGYLLSHILTLFLNIKKLFYASFAMLCILLCLHFVSIFSSIRSEDIQILSFPVGSLLDVYGRRLYYSRCCRYAQNSIHNLFIYIRIVARILNCLYNITYKSAYTWLFSYLLNVCLMIYLDSLYFYVWHISFF